MMAINSSGSNIGIYDPSKAIDYVLRSSLQLHALSNKVPVRTTIEKYRLFKTHNFLKIKRI